MSMYEKYRQEVKSIGLHWVGDVNSIAKYTTMSSKIGPSAQNSVEETLRLSVKLFLTEGIVSTPRILCWRTGHMIICQ